jgi:hypothetical protein
MPIHKSINAAVFGFRDIIPVAKSGDGGFSLGLIQIKAGKITKKIYEPLWERHPDMLWAFRDVESIERVIGWLEGLRDCMKEAKCSKK